MKQEIWKKVPWFRNVLASSEGRIMVVPYIKEIGNTAKRQYGGEPTFGFFDGVRHIYMYKRQNYKVARLVCSAFHGIPPKGKPLCLHIDENVHNNKPENLKWGTYKENANAPGYLKFCKTDGYLNFPAKYRGKKAS